MNFVKKIFPKLAVAMFAAIPLPPNGAYAGPCSDQLKQPWRNALVEKDYDKRLPIGIAFQMLDNGAIGHGAPNAVIDRPFYNAFWGSQWILFTADFLEFFTEGPVQGYYRDCEGPPFVAIIVGDDSAPITRTYDGPIFLDRHILSAKAKQLIANSESKRIYIATSIGSRFLIGDKSSSALRVLYANYK